MSISIYLNFNGNCREAIAFYTEALGVEKQPIMTFGDMPPDPNLSLTEDSKKLILHSFLMVQGTKLMFSDTLPNMPVTTGSNMSIVLNLKDVEEIKTIYNKLKEGGTVIMDLQETFWSKCYGTLTDRFGIGWQLSHDSEEI